MIFRNSPPIGVEEWGVVREIGGVLFMISFASEIRLIFFSFSHILIFPVYWREKYPWAFFLDIINRLKRS